MATMINVGFVETNSYKFKRIEDSDKVTIRLIYYER